MLFRQEEMKNGIWPKAADTGKEETPSIRANEIPKIPSLRNVYRQNLLIVKCSPLRRA